MKKGMYYGFIKKKRNNLVKRVKQLQFGFRITEISDKKQGVFEGGQVWGDHWPRAMVSDDQRMSITYQHHIVPETVTQPMSLTSTRIPLSSRTRGPATHVSLGETNLGSQQSWIFLHEDAPVDVLTERICWQKKKDIFYCRSMSSKPEHDYFLM